MKLAIFIPIVSLLSGVSQATAIPIENAALEEARVLFDDRCLPKSEATPGTVAEAVKCAEYLKSLKTQKCVAKKGGTGFYQVGKTRITGFAIGRDSASSDCYDVGLAVSWILDHCPACGGGNCAVAGVAAARGNGELIVKVSGA